MLLPLAASLASVVGMMIVFMHSGDESPGIILLLLLLLSLTIVNASWLELRQQRSGGRRRLPAWALPLAGTIGGLVACAQLALYLAASLQADPVSWYMHVPGVTAAAGLAGMLHALGITSD